ncbi:MAG: hypothetical protein ABI693_19675 [Bryobacteraceae bacterium]
MRWGRSLVALFAGAATAVVPAIATDAALHAAGILPAFDQPAPGHLLLLALLYRNIYGIAGSYVAASLAPAKPMTHALILGIIGFVMSIWGAVATWNGGAAYGPHWYPLALIATALPGAWLGGKLKGSRQ